MLPSACNCCSWLWLLVLVLPVIGGSMLPAVTHWPPSSSPEVLINTQFMHSGAGTALLPAAWSGWLVLLVLLVTGEDIMPAAPCLLPSSSPQVLTSGAGTAMLPLAARECCSWLLLLVLPAAAPVTAESMQPSGRPTDDASPLLLLGAEVLLLLLLPLAPAVAVAHVLPSSPPQTLPSA